MSIRRTAGPLAALTALTALLLLPLPSSGPAEAASGDLPPTTQPAAAERAVTRTVAAPAAPVLLEALAAEAPALDRDVLAKALDARAGAVAAGEASRDEILTVIDYSLPSTAKRLWVFDVAERELLYHELVAHGKNTGANMATRFSNTDGSLQTSLGLFRTAGTYHGRNGYSLRLHGLESGVNHLALPRAIVIHGAWYVSEEFARQQGRIGRSWGCPAVSEEVARPLIDTIKDGSLVFAYYPDERWLGGSKFLASSCGTGGTAPSTVVAAR